MYARTYYANIFALLKLTASGTVDESADTPSAQGLGSRLVKSPSRIFTIYERQSANQRSDIAKVTQKWLPESVSGSQADALNPASSEYIHKCHKTGSNYLMWDGHVEFMNRLNIPDFSWKYMYNAKKLNY